MAEFGFYRVLVRLDQLLNLDERAKDKYLYKMIAGECWIILNGWSSYGEITHRARVLDAVGTFAQAQSMAKCSIHKTLHVEPRARKDREWISRRVENRKGLTANGYERWATHPHLFRCNKMYMPKKKILRDFGLTGPISPLRSRYCMSKRDSPTSPNTIECGTEEQRRATLVSSGATPMSSVVTAEGGTGEKFNYGDLFKSPFMERKRKRKRKKERDREEGKGDEKDELSCWLGSYSMKNRGCGFSRDFLS
ncbi:hypothetical protein Scep_030057 [Stephania cephalantha]|uniref:Uncharacterized protein n=1 Tax=Stephania cephalantha TaxID=152367 RepID=A0AAP0DZ30_9MAGN